MSDYFSENLTKVAFDTNESWVILSPIEQSIKRKIEEIGTPLKDWDINIYRGILTGYNEAFIISGDKKAELLAACDTEDERARTDELIRPILRGRDIKRYNYDFADLWLINTHNGIKDKGVSRINIDDYPAIKMHLDQYWDSIACRADKGDTPYNLRNCAYMDDFNKQKIVWGNLNLRSSFAFAPEGIYINAPATMIIPYDKYLLAVLNSKLADYYIRNLGVIRNGGYFEYKPMFVEKLPIPINATNKLEISRLIDCRLAGEDVDEKLNQLIFELYGMSPEEIKVIEEN